MSICDANIVREYEIDVARSTIKKYEKLLEMKPLGISPDELVDTIKTLKANFEDDFGFSYDNTKEYMTAEEARKLLYNVQGEDNEELEKVLDLLKNAIINRKEHYAYFDSLRDYTIDKLKNLGYLVDTVWGDGVNQYKVSF